MTDPVTMTALMSHVRMQLIHSLRTVQIPFRLEKKQDCCTSHTTKIIHSFVRFCFFFFLHTFHTIHHLSIHSLTHFNRQFLCQFTRPTHSLPAFRLHNCSELQFPIRRKFKLITWYHSRLFPRCHRGDTLYSFQLVDFISHNLVSFRRWLFSYYLSFHLQKNTKNNKLIFDL